MRVVRERFVENLTTILPLQDRFVMQVGCGDGASTELLAPYCDRILGLDPDPAKIKAAKERGILRATFLQRSAQELGGLFKGGADVVLFTQSFYRLPVKAMGPVICDAIRCVESEDGYIVFFEPGTQGTFFEAENLFCGGADPGTKRLFAELAAQTHKGLQFVEAMTDIAEFEFESVSDFERTMEPVANKEQIEPFLRKHRYRLWAARPTNIYRPLSAA